jgi:hypothetical protein
MSDAFKDLGYNDTLKPLVDLLSGVKRPGDFHAIGSLVAPMPRLDIDGVGTVSFPIPPSQAREIIGQSTQAPYGKGDQTLIDTQVRKVWQVASEKIHLGGSTWTATLETILRRVTEELGCGKLDVSAELYKLLVYDPGSFFLAHRDTEKAQGMFGTLVIVLPSFHEGGELHIRHAGREVVADLASREVSQLSYAAFYADCEHEVKPVTEGNRVCLIYNLIQHRAGKTIKAPDYGPETTAAAGLLKEWMQSEGSPPKIVYLLEHQYTPASLSFAALKNGDAALAKALSDAGRQSGCAVHLGIVHIEESGSAELQYDSYSRRSRWNRHRSEDDDGSQEFEVIDVCDARQYIANWVDFANSAVDFGEIPLGENELLPQGALDGEAPDSQRVMEATGNEGATFERSYHRAAVVIWSNRRYPEILLQSGVGAVIPYLRKRIQECKDADSGSVGEDCRKEVLALTALINEAWKNLPENRRVAKIEETTVKRCEMLELLRTLEDQDLLQDFIEAVVTRDYNGTENEELTASTAILAPKAFSGAMNALIETNMPVLPHACIDLLKRLVRSLGRKPIPARVSACRAIAESVVNGLEKIQSSNDSSGCVGLDWWRLRQAKPVDGSMIAELFVALQKLDHPKLEMKAASIITARAQAFPPDSILLPALTLLHDKRGERQSDPAFLALWQSTASFHLERSEIPPEEPKDWSQQVKMRCRCELCAELETFARDPAQTVHRFRVRQDRRQHVQAAMLGEGFDMSHETDRTGSPQTLVCTKTRRIYQNRLKQYASDVEAFGTLLKIADGFPKELKAPVEKLSEAVRRSQK